MTTTKQTNGFIALAFVIGLGLGYLAAFTMGVQTFVESPEQTIGMHQMPDGTMMSDMPGSSGSSMAAMMHDMNAALEGKSGAEFDKAFLSEMIVHHEGAVEMAKQVLERSTRPELRTLAQDIIEAQTKEIQMMRTWETQWFAN